MIRVNLSDEHSNVPDWWIDNVRDWLAEQGTKSTQLLHQINPGMSTHQSAKSATTLIMSLIWKGKLKQVQALHIYLLFWSNPLSPATALLLSLNLLFGLLKSDMAGQICSFKLTSQLILITDTQNKLSSLVRVKCSFHWQLTKNTSPDKKIKWSGRWRVNIQEPTGTKLTRTFFSFIFLTSNSEKVSCLHF